MFVVPVQSTVFVATVTHATRFTLLPQILQGVVKLLYFPSYISQVRSWLEQLFQSQGSVPEYEINSQTIEVLYQMALGCEVRERSAKVIIEDLEQKAEEYTAESELNQSTLLATYFTIEYTGGLRIASSSGYSQLHEKSGRAWYVMTREYPNHEVKRI